MATIKAHRRVILFLIAWLMIPGLLAHIITRYTGIHGVELFAVGAVVLGIVGATVNAMYCYAFPKGELTAAWGALLGATSGIVAYPVTWVLLGGLRDWWPLELPLLSGLVVVGLSLGLILTLLFLRGRYPSSQAQQP
jgi:hypothetical protein